MCELLAGYNAFEMCDTQGGVSSWVALNRKDVDTFTVVDGEVTAFTLKPTKKAFEFLVEQESSTFTDTAIGSMANKSYARDMSATVVLHGNTADIIKNVEALGKARTVWVCQLNDGTYEVLFASKGAKAIDVRTPGTAFDDLNGNTITLTGRESSKAPKISATLVQSLLVP